ncbi:MAG: hypothetical protein KDB71_09050 [Mycobacterium sp.]|nr:hypothetical protein [Mycobacterium sp.]
MIDVLATAALSILALLAAGAAVFSSPFLLMATDSAGEKPRLSALWWAYAVIGTAVALGLIGAIVGIIEAARHHATMWPWPAAGLAVIALGYGLGVFLATKVVRKATS